MTRAWIIALSVAAASVLFAPASMAGDMSGLFGNTIVCTYADGKVTKVYVASDGTYKINRRGEEHIGKWVDTGDTACYTEDGAPADAKPVCTSSAPKKVGDTWDVVDPGGACHAVLQAGMQ